jgi:hypothetical protein
LLELASRFTSWLDRQTVKQEERERINKANTERLERQSEVAQKPVTRDDLDKSLRGGTF